MTLKGQKRLSISVTLIHGSWEPFRRTTRFWPYGNAFNNLSYNYNRARFTWFTMDPLFYRNNSVTPPHIKNDLAMRSNLFLKEVQTTEVFKGFQPPYPIVNPTQQILDLHFYPNERGPYNFDVNSFDPLIDTEVRLLNPTQNFGSMMRRMETTDWDAANISISNSGCSIRSLRMRVLT